MKTLGRQMLCYLLLCFAVTTYAEETISINTDNTSLIYKVDKDKKLRQVYFGSFLDEKESEATQVTKADAYPTFGTSYVNEAALRAVHGDGNTSTELYFEGVEQNKLSDDITETIITLKDGYFPFTVKLCFKSYAQNDVIEQWSEISHTEKKPVTLYNYASSHLFFNESSYHLTQFCGEWAMEMNMVETQLSRGVKNLESKLGVRSNQHSHPCFYLSLDGKAQEKAGRVVGGTLAWPGSYRLSFEVDHRENLHIISGINPYASQYILNPKEVFRTPALLYSYSSKGTGDISRRFHRWAKKYGIYRGDKTRTTLLNNWEATYFNFDEEVLSGIIKDAADMGFELFLLDDGWFANKYPRDNDKAGLGDWDCNKKKLPHGLGYLVNESKKKGIKFGIWLEPEMVNPKSELYEKHPDWILKAPNRELVLGRGGTQVVLDLANPKVQDFIFGMVDNLMTNYPEIDYIKWDANMSIMNHGSNYLSDNDQSHMYIAYHKGFETICQRIRAKYPEVTIQACASGGGRVNYGLLPYFDEFWVSDNTDAMQRIYMQYGTSYFFPAIAMASHISAVPNHTVFRTTSLKYRIDVAMSGRLGMEIQPKNMTDEEKALCRKAISEYKEIRPVVQFGDLYRLVSPYDNQGLSSIMYVSEAKDKAVFYWWKLVNFYNVHLPRVKMAGLDENKMYKVKELDVIDNKPLDCEGKSYSGKYLMEHGLEMPYVHEVDWGKKNDWSSRVLYLEAE